ncbi:hypothetical protein OH492_07720 [Vibrio chagasii]|nr:hypothetical protein [Vibrio chagasii]
MLGEELLITVTTQSYVEAPWFRRLQAESRVHFLPVSDGTGQSIHYVVQS